MRYSEYLEAFRSSPDLSALYGEAYPASLFLPWKALHQVMRSLDLWIDLPSFYAGAVPDEELLMMEIFEMDPVHRPRAEDMNPLLDRQPDPLGRDLVRLLAMLEEGRDTRGFDLSMFRRETLDFRPFWEQIQDSFFVVAPPEAFTSEEDWLARLRRLNARVEQQDTVPPDDPLVVRMVAGGVLVVAAWGDEGAELNRITRELNI